MVWVEQPVGTGFSQGTPDITDETGVASEFLGFWKNFVNTFGLQNRKVYISGESYAGYYVPYIADAMLNSNDTKYFDVESILIHDPSTSTEAVQQQSKHPTFQIQDPLTRSQFLPLPMSTIGPHSSLSMHPSLTSSTSKPTPADTPPSSTNISYTHPLGPCPMILPANATYGMLSFMPNCSSILALTSTRSPPRVRFCGMSSDFPALLITPQ